MNSDHSFFAELKRRKVVRIAGGYLVAAWIILQVAATLMPALELPGWTVKLVAVLLILGFPLALLLGWVFDLTPGGIERTSDAAKFHFPVRAAALGTFIVIAGVTGFLAVRHNLSAKGIDPNSVVVLPFRVSGSQELELMREGMVDLIVPKLTGEGGPRAVDSRTTLSAWRGAVSSENEDLAPKDAIKLARKLKASQVILGEVVGTAARISINARVYSTIDGVASDPARVTTTQDSLLPAVDVLIAELLSRQAGEGDRLSALLTSSLPAVQAYLDGTRNYRHGKYTIAAKHFGEAVDIDSTFALAAYGELMARSFAGFGPRYVRATQLAFRFKDRLPPRERDLLVARVGPEYPTPRSYNEALRGWEQISTKYPDSPEMWYELGDHYFHGGQPRGMEDYEDRALKAWERAVALDSSYAPPLEHQMEIHAARNDTARLRVVFEKLKQLEGAELRASLAWLYALTVGDDTLRARLLKEAPTWSATEYRQSVIGTLKSGLSPVGLDTVVKYFIASASTDQARQLIYDYAAQYELNRGRPSAALAHWEAVRRLPNPGAEINYAAGVTFGALAYPELDRTVAEQAIEQLRKAKSPDMGCSVGLWDALEGRSESSARLRAVMRDSAERRSGQGAYFLRFCEQLIKAAEAAIGKQPNARVELERMDSLMMNGPSIGANGSNITAVLMARLYTEVGDFERARHASLRGGYATFVLAAQTLEHARMAARVGKRDEAIRMYRVYLAMRPDPEPGPAKDITDKVRTELAALTSR